MKHEIEIEKLNQAGFDVNYINHYNKYNTDLVVLTLEYLIDRGFFPRGTKVRFNDINGYEVVRERAREIIGDKILTVKSCDVGSSYSTYSFEEVDGNWNSVMFDRISDEA